MTFMLAYTKSVLNFQQFYATREPHSVQVHMQDSTPTLFKVIGCNLPYFCSRYHL